MKVSLEVVNFKQEMERVRREAKALANKSISEKLQYATDTLRIVTPVDTGKARSGWKLKKERNYLGFNEAVISNDVEYISDLNRGHSKQAPKYFIEQTLSSIGILKD